MTLICLSSCRRQCFMVFCGVKGYSRGNKHHHHPSIHPSIHPCTPSPETGQGAKGTRGPGSVWVATVRNWGSTQKMDDLPIDNLGYWGVMFCWKLVHPSRIWTFTHDCDVWMVFRRYLHVPTVLGSSWKTMKPPTMYRNMYISVSA